MQSFLKKAKRYIYTTRLVYIADGALFVLLIIPLFSAFLISSNNTLFGILGSWASIISVLFALFHHTYTRFDARKNFEQMSLELEPYLSKFETAIVEYLPDIKQSDLEYLENEALQTVFTNYSENFNSDSLDYELLLGYSRALRQLELVGYSEKLFIEYRIITSELQHHYSKFAAQIDIGSLRNDPVLIGFGKLLYLFERNIKFTLNEKPDNIDNQKSEDALTSIFQLNTTRMREILRNDEERSRTESLLSKAIENAYTNLGTLQGIGTQGGRKIPLLFKYDEKYAEARKKWESEISKYISGLKLNEAESNIKKKEIEDELNKTFGRQPFSRALVSFKGAIRQVGRDYFLYIIDPDSFPNESRGFTPERFIKKNVLPKARELQTETNKEIIKKFPFLKGKLKRRLDANYYIIYFDPIDVNIQADPKSTPKSLKLALSKSLLLDDENLDKFSSQVIYIKQVINSLTISGLLFTENYEVQEKYRKIEKRIYKACEKEGINIRSVLDISQLGNSLEALIAIIFPMLHPKKKISKQSKYFREVKKDVEKIVENSTQVIGLLEKLKKSRSPNR